ncbi:MAG: hypothetical protein AAFQ36_03460 [Pseudomonadota bacterium]
MTDPKDTDNALIAAAFQRLETADQELVPSDQLLERIFGDAAEVIAERNDASVQDMSEVEAEKPSLFGWAYEVWAGVIALTAAAAAGLFVGYLDPVGLGALLMGTAAAEDGFSAVTVWLEGGSSL